MGNMCCRRDVGYSPNGDAVEVGRFHSNQQEDHHQQKTISAPMSAFHNTGDDCAINELLEGRMELDVILPDSRKVRFTVERRTPMMDLLVQAASATKISPAGHTIHVFGDNGKGSSTLHYKPSTPIGSLDTNTICIVPKKDGNDATGKRAPKTANRPFEPTFRVQVHLPRNQLTVVRVSPRITISELRAMVCREKGLDTGRFQLVRPSDPGQPVAGHVTLADYGATEITLLSNSCIESHICNSTSYIISYPKRAEEPKKKTGILRLLDDDTNNKVYKKTQTNTPPVTHQPPQTTKAPTEAPHRFKPKKRRPAPPPPQTVLPEPFHSRQSSSDSSGYHEATSSYLREDHCVSVEEKASSDSSGVSSLNAKVQPQVNNVKKRKAPLPPSGGEKEDEKLSEEDKQQVEEFLNITKEEKILSNAVPKSSPVAQQEDSRIPEHSLKKASGKDNDDAEETVTRVALVALNARIEQDVTGQEIASCIQAAFHSLENRIEPSVDKQKTSPALIQKNPEPTLAEKQCEPVLQKSISTSNQQKIVIHEKPEPSLTKKDCEPTLVRIKPEPIQTSSEISVQKPKSSVNQQKSVPSVIHQKSVTSSLQQKSQTSLDQKCEISVQQKKYISPVLKQQSEPSLLAIKRRDGPVIPAHGLSSSTSIQNGLNNLLDKKSSEDSGYTDDKPLNLTSTTDDKSTGVFHKSCVNVKVENNSVKLSQKTSPGLSAVNVPISSFQLKKSVVNLKPENKASNVLSIKNSVSKPLHTVHKEGAGDLPKQSLSSNGSVGDTLCNLYPLQKSSVKLNFEPKDSVEDSLEVFPPPPSEFRSDAPPTTPQSTSKTLRRSSSLLNLAPPQAKSSRVRHLQRSLSDLSIDDKGEFEAEQERLQREYVKLQRQFILWQQQLMSNHAMLSEECLVPQYARQLRQSHSLPEGEDYSEAPCPLVSRSLSYEPSRSTLPRSTINIPSLEFGSTTSISNGTSTLRSSKTKSYFKPPQVRVSTKNRQRLPPEIRKDRDLDIYDDKKILSTILPSFDSLKLISENEDADAISKLKSNNQPLTKLETLRNSLNQKDSITTVLKNTEQATKLENLLNGNDSSVIHSKHSVPKFQFGTFQNSNGHGLENLLKKDEIKKVPPPVPNKTSSLPKHIFGQNIGNGHKLVNGDTGQSKVNGFPDPPPPPPTPQVNGKIISKVSSGLQKKILEQQVDPREQLMQEIRKCGGRTALRKISLDMAS